MAVSLKALDDDDGLDCATSETAKQGKRTSRSFIRKIHLDLELAILGASTLDVQAEKS